MFTGRGELVVVDALLRYAQISEQRDGRLDHRWRAAHVRVDVGELALLPPHDVGDEADLALPAVAVGRLGQRRHVAETRQRLLELAQLLLEAQVLRGAAPRSSRWLYG